MALHLCAILLCSRERVNDICHISMKTALCVRACAYVCMCACVLVQCVVRAYVRAYVRARTG